MIITYYIGVNILGQPEYMTHYLTYEVVKTHKMDRR
jgi:hypothetical protein